MTSQPQVIRSTGIKSWSPEDRPREKLMQHGVESLSDAELIAILLRVGTKERSAVALAKDVMAAYGNKTSLLAKTTIQQLTQAKGIGPSKAVTIKAAIELGRRCGIELEDDRPVISSSGEAFQMIRRVLSHQPHEEFWIAIFNQANRVIGKWRISVGSINCTVVDIRIILKKCIEHLAAGLMIFHNHPSGQLRPSDADIRLTRKIQEAANYFDIRLLDHLIVSDSRYYSFADEGIL